MTSDNPLIGRLATGPGQAADSGGSGPGIRPARRLVDDDARLRALSGRISAAADEYDAHLIYLAKSAAACRTVDDMRAWLFERGDGASARADDSTVTASFIGRLQDITAELTRWVERIAAAPESGR